VRKRLAEAQKLLKKDDHRAFHAALTQAVLGYLGDRFNLEAHALTKDQLRVELERRQVPADSIAAVIEIIDTCEIARFSPGMLASHDPAKLLERARDVLGRL
jgi:hypothetical protein